MNDIAPENGPAFVVLMQRRNLPGCRGLLKVARAVDKNDKD
jgi:hypothetical protein